MSRRSGSRGVAQHAIAIGKSRVTQVAGDYYASADGPAPKATASLPADLKPLVGRQEKVRELLSLLSPGAEGAQSVVVTAVTGLPGVGKTALAVHAARQAQQVARWFDGGVLFADLRGYDPAGQVTADQVLSRWLRDLGTRDADVPPTPEERKDLYRSVLYRLAEKGHRLLLVADNASSADQVRPLIPPRSEHRMLITSRDTLISLPARLVDLAQLDPGPAAALIADVLRRARPGDPRPQAEPVALGRLAEVCGGLPLALEIVAQILAGDPGLPIACVSEEVENEQTLHLGTARAAFDLSYRRLGREPARLFRLLSLNPGRGVATEAAAALANQSISQTRELLAALARASLLDEQPTGSGWWLMHDLIHVYAVSLAEQDRNGGETAEALDRLLQHYAATANDAVSQLAGQPGQEVSDRFRNRADALAWLDRERPNLVAAVKLAADNERATPTASISLNQMAASLALTLVPFLNLRFRFDESLVVSELAVTTARRLDNVEQETQAMLNLGRAQNSLRRFEEALRTNRQVKQMARAVGDRHSEALALGYCGIALQGLLRFDEAIAAYQGSITIFHELGEPTSEAAALNDVGVAQGKMRLFEEAAITYRAAAELSRQAGDRALEASTLVNLGGILVESRHIQEAITAGYEALAIYQELGDKYGEGRAWHNLGIAIRRVQHLEKGAIAVLENAVRSFREAGDLHGAADALNSLGLALAQVRRSRNQAVAAYQQAVELYNETNDRQGAAKALVNLSSALDDLRRSEEAITAAQQALAIFQAVGDRYGEGAALIGLGGALSSARRFEEAITAFEQAQIALRESGDRKGEKLAAYNLAAARTNQKRRALFRGRPFHV